MTEHQIRLYDTSGILQYVLTDYLWLSYTKRVNYPGLAQFGLSGDHPAVTDLADKWKVEVQRRDKANGIDWTTEFEGLYREPEQVDVSPGTFSALCPGNLSMLGWRIVAWKAGTASRSEFTTDPAETIIKTLVEYNAAASATTGNGRELNGAITGLSVEADGANGNTLNWYCAWKNVLEELQKLALIGGGDFDLVRTGANTYEFRWYTGQLGTDRTATALFSTGRGNMANPHYRIRRINEKTVAVVAGQGEGSQREVITRTGANYDASANHIEVLVDARDIAAGDTGGLNARGDQAMDEAEAEEDFEFDFIQIPGSLYGTHYFLGDLVSAESPFTGTVVNRKINAVTVDVKQAGREDIKVELGNA